MATSVDSVSQMADALESQHSSMKQVSINDTSLTKEVFMVSQKLSHEFSDPTDLMLIFTTS